MCGGNEPFPQQVGAGDLIRAKGARGFLLQRNWNQQQSVTRICVGEEPYAPTPPPTHPPGYFFARKKKPWDTAGSRECLKKWRT